jgi:hypothetical protein
MLIHIFSPTECGLIRDADLKKCGLNRMTTVIVHSEPALIVLGVLIGGSEPE